MNISENTKPAPLTIEPFSITRLCADFLSLTKPGVILLLLVSTVCPMVLAGGGTASLKDILLVCLGGGLISGSAGAINCIWDRDIDAIMMRTKKRPLAAGRLSVPAALIFSFFIGCLGLVILTRSFNPLTAAAALFGHLFYVFVYTIWLKRSTPQNIVIGGAAGAIPPIVGWAAVTNQISLEPLLMFLVIFLWTPPHFWALALNKNEDYQRAGVPMLPVVAGDRVTHNQMFAYALALLPVSLLLVLSDPHLGIFSAMMFTTLGSTFAFKIWQLKMIPAEAKPEKTKKAWDIFGFSLIYLALFFVTIVVDGTLI